MTRKSQSHTTGLWVIAIFKLTKALLLLLTGLGALSLLHENVAAQVSHWINTIGVDPDNRFIHGLVEKLWAVDDKKLVAISAGSFFYAALMFTEGIGLALHKRWAEYFTIIVTASFIPLEVYELAHHFSVAKVVVILINVAIIVYLIIKVRAPQIDWSTEN